MIFKSLLAGIFLQAGTALYAQAPDAKAISIYQTESYGEQVVRVSFDAEATSFGMFKITDSHGQVVVLIREAELIPSPNYFSVSTEALKKGEEYVFSIETPKQVYTTRFKLQ